MKGLVLAVSLAVVFMLLLGCAGNEQAQPAGLPQAGINNSGMGDGSAAGVQPELIFNGWEAPDGSIALQVPEGWQAAEAQVDKCTVNWAVNSPDGKSSAYASNQILVFKSDAARQTYQSYGLQAAGSAPVSAYLGAEQAVRQIIAPLTGASDVHVTYTYPELSSQYSSVACIAGLAACDAKVFEAAYQMNGTLMRGTYFVQSSDLGDGTTWWINIWGFTSPASEWDRSAPVLGKIFASANYTKSWAAKCGNNPGASDYIGGVVNKSRDASEKSAEAWDNYILGG